MMYYLSGAQIAEMAIWVVLLGIIFFFVGMLWAVCKEPGLCTGGLVVVLLVLLGAGIYLLVKVLEVLNL